MDGSKPRHVGSVLNAELGALVRGAGSTGSRARRQIAIAALVLALAACSTSDDPLGPARRAASANPRDALLDAWKKGGLVPSPMTPASVPFAQDCHSGTVNAVDVLVCVMASPADAKAAEPQALGWVGEATGAAEARGALLIAVSDRRKSDPSGRTMNELLKLAPK